MSEDRKRVAPSAMSLVAHQEDHKHLSDAGCEVLEMMEYTSRNSGFSIADAYVEASATTLASPSATRTSSQGVPLARRTLIEAFSENTGSEK